MQEEDMWLKQN